MSTLVEANKTLHEAKHHADVTIKMQPIPVQELRFVACSDASFSSNKQPGSHQEMMIVACHEPICINRTGPVSTVSAEAMSFAGAVDMLSWVRLYWGWLMNVNIP